MLVKAMIAFFLIAIIFSLGSGLLYLVKDKGTTKRTVKSLSLRIGLSIALFLFLLFAGYMGWITPNSPMV